MEPILYKAARGALTGFDSQKVTANNMANSNTPGFKADLFVAQQQLSNQQDPNKAPAFSKLGINLTQGPLITTGRDLDVAVQGDGWLAVQDSKGKEAYTRAGSLQINASGQLTTASGRVVLGDGGPIAIPAAQSIEIAADGTISIVPVGGKSNELAVLDRLKMVSIAPQNVMKNEEGLMQLKPGTGFSDNSKITLVHGALEGSNVNAVDEMVKMIDSGRGFESHLKIIQHVDENGQKLAQLLQD
jgi:flagellar basal-body rod protein FlgF